MLKKLLPAYSRGMKLIQRHYYLLLLIFVINSTYVMAQLPSNEEVMALAITQKKATDSKDALPFTPAPGRRVKLYAGHFTSLYNTECLAVCSFLQGRDIIQTVLLLFKTQEGYWRNGCWYYENIYRVNVKDVNKDSVLEIILETKLNAGNRAFGNYKLISLLNLNQQVWYENHTVLGYDAVSLKNSVKGKEVSKDVKVTFIDSVAKAPCIIKERTTLGKFNHYSDSSGVNLEYSTSTIEYYFKEFKYIPKLK